MLPTKNAKSARSATVKTDRAFSARKGGQGSALTRERIADDIAAFRRAGGKIEVLGVTQALKNIAPDEGAATPRPVKAAPARGRR